MSLVFLIFLCLCLSFSFSVNDGGVRFAWLMLPNENKAS